MEFKTVNYDSKIIKEGISHKGRRKSDDPVKIFSQQLKDQNVLYFFYKDDECLYIGQTGICLWDRIIRHEDPEKDSKWFEEAHKICLIILDKKVDVISRRNLESTFIVNYLRAGHKLYNKE